MDSERKIPPKPRTETEDYWVLCRRSYGECRVFMPEHRLIVGPGDYAWLPKHEAGFRADFEVVEGESPPPIGGVSTESTNENLSDSVVPRDLGLDLPEDV